MSQGDEYPYSCDVKISFPTDKQAEIAMKVLQVDQEVGNRVRKSFSIDSSNDENPRILKVYVCTE